MTINGGGIRVGDFEIDRSRSFRFTSSIIKNDEKLMKMSQIDYGKLGKMKRKFMKFYVIIECLLNSKISFIEWSLDRL